MIAKWSHPWARPHLTADRTPVVVEDGADHHLVQVRTVVLAKAPATDIPPAATIKIDRAGVEKDESQLAEQAAVF